MSLQFLKKRMNVLSNYTIPLEKVKSEERRLHQRHVTLTSPNTVPQIWSLGDGGEFNQMIKKRNAFLTNNS